MKKLHNIFYQKMYLFFILGFFMLNFQMIDASRGKAVLQTGAAVGTVAGRQLFENNTVEATPEQQNYSSRYQPRTTQTQNQYRFIQATESLHKQPAQEHQFIQPQPKQSSNPIIDMNAAFSTQPKSTQKKPAINLFPEKKSQVTTTRVEDLDTPDLWSNIHEEKKSNLNNEKQPDEQNSQILMEKIEKENNPTENITPEIEAGKQIEKIVQEPKITTPETLEQSRSAESKLDTHQEITTNNNEFNLAQIEPQQISVQQEYHLEQLYVDAITNIISRDIETWLDDYQDATSNIYVQKNLEDDILQKLTYQKTDEIVIEKAMKKYEKNKDLINVLRSVATKIENKMATEKITPQQANRVIARYYAKNLRQDVFNFIKPDKQPIFNEKGTITNMPTVEEVIQAAQENPTIQAYKALKASLQATEIALYAFRHNTTTLGFDGTMLTQLKEFKNDITQALKNPHFDKFETLGTSFSKALTPSAQTVLDSTGLSQLKISTVLDYTQSALDLTGYGEKSLSELTKNSFNKNEPIQPSTKNRSDTTKTIEQETHTIAEQTIAQYCDPSMLNEIYAVMKLEPKFDQVTQTFTNMPSVEKIITTATDQPSEQMYHALQTTLEGVNIAIVATKDNDQFFNQIKVNLQLKNYKKQLETALKNPAFTPYLSLTSHVKSYTTSFASSIPEFMLQKTSVGSMTPHQILDAAKTGLKYSGYGDLTVGQAASMVGVS